jgi:uncharacterized protein YigE (DUF2233 family)
MKAAYNWILLNDGIVYAKYSFPSGGEGSTTLHAFQIDPAKARLDVVIADKKQAQGSSVRDMAAKNKAALVINGGFFTEEHKSIGLLIKSGKVVNPIHRTSWWSIFGIKNGTPFISTPRDFFPAPDISMAVQAGPRLVVDGTYPKLKEGLAARSAVGITRDGKVLIVVTEGMPVTMREIARRMGKSRFEGGLECVNAMALDGGSSVQLYSKIGKFELDISGISLIPNGLAVFLK